MSFDMTAAEDVLKRLYADQRLTKLWFENNPFLAHVPKRPTFTGKVIDQPVSYASHRQGSASFSVAQANANGPAFVSFAVTRRKGYAVGLIDGEVLHSSKNDAGAFVEAIKINTEGAINTLTNDLSRALYRNGDGVIGVLNANPSTGVCTLTVASDAVFFQVGDLIEAYSGATKRTGQGYVIAVDRSAGTVTVSTTSGGSAGTPTGWVSGDELVPAGNRNACLDGLLSWIPSTAPSGSDSHFGVNRSQDTQRLAGLRFDGSGMAVNTALIRAAVELGRLGGAPTHCYISYNKYGDLLEALDTKVQYVEPDKTVGIGFEGIKLHGGSGGTIQVFPDRSCPEDKSFLLTLSDFCFRSTGEAPQIDKDDGAMLRRSHNSDAVEFRVKWYGNLVCQAPGRSAVITF